MFMNCSRGTVLDYPPKAAYFDVLGERSHGVWPASIELLGCRHVKRRASTSRRLAAELSQQASRARRRGHILLALDNTSWRSDRCR
jgi:hypothetical protein